MLDPDFVLSGSLLTGHSKLDAQHQSLIDLIKSIGRALDKQEAPIESCERIAKALRAHSRFEETLMHQIGYPNVEVHQRHHRALHAKMDEVLADCNGGSNCDSCTITNLLDIVVDDMIQSDSDFTGYLRQQRTINET